MESMFDKIRSVSKDLSITFRNTSRHRLKSFCDRYFTFAIRIANPSENRSLWLFQWQSTFQWKFQCPNHWNKFWAVQTEKLFSVPPLEVSQYWSRCNSALQHDFERLKPMKLEFIPISLWIWSQTWDIANITLMKMMKTWVIYSLAPNHHSLKVRPALYMKRMHLTKMHSP